MKNLSLGGCGFMGIYHVGVVKAIKERKPEYLHKIAGTSCGALVAAATVCDCPMDDIASMFYQMSVEGNKYFCGPFNPKFDLPVLLEKLIDKTLPMDAHIRCTDRVFISVTRASDTKSIIISSFETREDLVQALLASTFVPIYSGFTLPKYKGISYYDGCWSDNNPTIDEHTLLVAPFNGESDICPKNESAGFYCSDFQNTSVLWCFENVPRTFKVFFPPHEKWNEALFYRGYRDAIYYLKSQDYKSNSLQMKYSSFESDLANEYNNSKMEEFNLSSKSKSACQKNRTQMTSFYLISFIVLFFLLFATYIFQLNV